MFCYMIKPCCVNFTGAHVNEDDFLLLELLNWFKNDFFHWVNSLPCSRCGGQTEQKSDKLTPTDDDLRWNASRVENHYCNQCQFCNRFPRWAYKDLLCFFLVFHKTAIHLFVLWTSVVTWKIREAFLSNMIGWLVKQQCIFKIR